MFKTQATVEWYAREGTANVSNGADQNGKTETQTANQKRRGTYHGQRPRPPILLCTHVSSTNKRKHGVVLHM